MWNLKLFGFCFSLSHNAEVQHEAVTTLGTESDSDDDEPDVSEEKLDQDYFQPVMTSNYISSAFPLNRTHLNKSHFPGNKRRG